MSYKRLFSRAFEAAPGRLHFAAHSHHLWPDVSRDAQIEAWDDAVRLADLKWDRIFGEVWPEAQRHVAAELGLAGSDSIAFAPNTHEFLVRVFSAIGKRPLRVLSTDGEFHSFRRQAARLAETGEFALERVPCEPSDDFEERFLARARSGEHDLIFVSHVFFKTGRVFRRALELAELARPDGPWVFLDGYHAFMAQPLDLSSAADRIFYTSGGYKYAMTGEGAAFLHAPAGFGERPANTGWFAEFADLSGPPGGVGYGRDGSRFMGATFDATGVYRLNAVFRLLRREGLTTAKISAWTTDLQARLSQMIASGAAGRLAEAEVLNPVEGDAPRARFLAFRHPEAQAWKAALQAANLITDVRDDVLRVGLAIYHDPEDLDAFAAVCRRALRAAA